MVIQKICVHFENCYGIGELDHKFEMKFDKPKPFYAERVHAIYASNGVMKTSFANTFYDLQNVKESKDIMYPERLTVVEINDEKGSPLKKEQVYVISPYRDFESDKISLLVATEELKHQYDSIHLNIETKKEELLIKIKVFSKLRANDDNEKEILTAFGENDLLICLEKMAENIKELENIDLADIKYKEIFNDHVLKFLGDKENKKILAEYIEKFNELTEKSEYFMAGTFTHNNAFNVSDNLKANNFFKANHSVILKSKSGMKPVTSDDELNEVIESEKEKIISDKELKAKFDRIDNAITKNKQLNEFREFLESNRNVIPKLMDLSEFKKELWLNYIKKEEDTYLELLNLYENAKLEIKGIVNRTKSETTKWEEVISKFNDRFFVPFEVKIENREDVILRDEVPVLTFIFNDRHTKKAVDRNTILQVLSEGEKRSLYLLNILYEVEARKQSQQETIFIIDDIADSFDYKNKYAILEYLIEISREDFFYEIILTHNFDFFRTINLKFVSHENCYVAEKRESKIELNEASDIKNPIKGWIGNISDNEYYPIAIIPFIRNIIEYTRGNQDKNYMSLTSMLHIKEESDLLEIKDLEGILKTELNKKNLNLKNNDKKILDAIWECSEKCLTSSRKSLDKKLILSIGTRLQAEKYMIEKINDSDFLKGISKNQTVHLLNEYRNRFNSDVQSIKLLEKVNLMTPENIHVNSFMYEPIIDMSGEHLCKLYEEVRDLNSQNNFL